ncbi:hypothetical protein [Arenibacter certesii]|uniref:Uncharacterized protein n=1 Tax=Arenibacter certesii TaxID=228955 RepID=A0A918ML70_9FLAO|nr:hypothetical protein [Arenibacter certesii]GGW37125.1 hypothetical protein GCM10007383_22480 [Arenibacter certesii]
MSGLAHSYEKAIKKELGAHAAWLPVTNTLSVGDFGYFEGGVFRSVGNLNKKYPDIVLDITPGPATKVNFTTEGTRITRVGADGKSTDSFASLGDAEAALNYKFEKENSLVIKAEKVTVDQLQNIDEVALALAGKSEWRKKYKVISAVYTGENCLIICAREAGSDFSIKASANILGQIEGGKAEGGLNTSSSTASTFNSIGESGVVGIRLFKLNWFNKTKLLGDDQLTAEDITIEDTLDKAIEDDF